MQTSIRLFMLQESFNLCNLRGRGCVLPTMTSTVTRLNHRLAWLFPRVLLPFISLNRWIELPKRHIYTLHFSLQKATPHHADDLAWLDGAIFWNMKLDPDSSDLPIQPDMFADARIPPTRGFGSGFSVNIVNRTQLALFYLLSRCFAMNLFSLHNRPRLVSGRQKRENRTTHHLA